MFNLKLHLCVLVFIPLIFSQSLWAGGDNSAIGSNRLDESDASQVDYPLAKLRSASIEVDQVKFVALSNGCSLAGDFKLEVLASVLSIKRLRKDKCRKKPQWKRFILPLSYEGRVDALTLANDLFSKSVRQTR